MTIRSALEAAAVRVTLPAAPTCGAKGSGKALMGLQSSDVAGIGQRG